MKNVISCKKSIFSKEKQDIIKLLNDGNNAGNCEKSSISDHRTIKIFKHW